MSVVIKTEVMKYKNPDGTYNGFNAIAQEFTAHQVASIQSAGTTQVNNINAKGQEVLASIPSDYTELTQEVSDLNQQTSDLKSAFIQEKAVTSNNGMSVEINPFPNSPIHVTGTATSSTPVYLNKTGINMLPFPHNYPVGERTSNGVTFTENSDGTILANGTASADISYIVWSSNVRTIYSPSANNRNLMLVGCPSGGSSSTYFLELGWLGAKDTGNGIAFVENPQFWTKQRSYVRLFIKSGTTVNNLLFKPMVYVCDKSTNFPYGYNDYMPYKGEAKLLTPSSGQSYTISETVTAFPNNDEPTFVFVVSESNTSGEPREQYNDLVSSITVDYEYGINNMVEDQAIELESLTKHIDSSSNYLSSPIFGVAHRGLDFQAPENTMPSFVMARKAGFRYTEFDVRWTSDNIPVLLHDATINRTARNADGTAISETINVNSLTYSELQNYDFGIWKGSSFAGTKIPKFEDVLMFCRKSGLIPIIEVKTTNITQARVETLVDMVKAFGLSDVAMWLSDYTTLGMVKTLLPSATLLGGLWATIAETDVTALSALKTDTNEVVGCMPLSLQTTASIKLLLDANIKYTSGEEVNNASNIINLPTSLSMIFSGNVLPEQVLYENAMA